MSTAITGCAGAVDVLPVVLPASDVEVVPVGVCGVVLPVSVLDICGVEEVEIIEVRIDSLESQAVRIRIIVKMKKTVDRSLGLGIGTSLVRGKIPGAVYIDLHAL